MHIILTGRDSQFLKNFRSEALRWKNFPCGEFSVPKYCLCARVKTLSHGRLFFLYGTPTLRKEYARLFRMHDAPTLSLARCCTAHCRSLLQRMRRKRAAEKDTESPNHRKLSALRVMMVVCGLYVDDVTCGLFAAFASPFRALRLFVRKSQDSFARKTLLSVRNAYITEGVRETFPYA